MAANSPEKPVPMITVSKWRGCIGLPAYPDISFVADSSDALIFTLFQAVGCQCSCRDKAIYRGLSRTISIGSDCSPAWRPRFWLNLQSEYDIRVEERELRAKLSLRIRVFQPVVR